MRGIKFEKLLKVRDWKVKIYTISKLGDFKATSIYNSALLKLTDWIDVNNSSNQSIEKIAFYIIISNPDEVLSIVNWWIGDHNLHTDIYSTDYNKPEFFKDVNEVGLEPCKWELEVLLYERKSWIENIVKKPNSPDFINYSKDFYGSSD